MGMVLSDVAQGDFILTYQDRVARAWEICFPKRLNSRHIQKPERHTNGSKKQKQHTAVPVFTRIRAVV